MTLPATVVTTFVRKISPLLSIGKMENKGQPTNLDDFLDAEYDSKDIDLEGSIRQRLSVDYDEDDDGYFAAKVNEAPPGKVPLPKAAGEKENEKKMLERRKGLHNTNFVLACTRGQIDKVRALLQHEDTDINFREDINLFSPLHACVINGHYKVLRALLKLKNVDTEIYDRVGWTPIMYAARHDEADCVALLLEHPANANATTTTGKTALILSSERGHYSCVKLLCEYSGTNLYHKDKTFNMNALEWAQKKGRRAVVNYLKMVFAGESEKQGDDNRGNGL